MWRIAHFFNKQYVPYDLPMNGQWATQGFNKTCHLGMVLMVAHTTRNPERMQHFLWCAVKPSGWIFGQIFPNLKKPMKVDRLIGWWYVLAMRRLKSPGENQWLDGWNPSPSGWGKDDTKPVVDWSSTSWRRTRRWNCQDAGSVLHVWNVKETPNCFSICLYCNGLMVSHGIRPPVFEIIDNDTDEEKRQIDEQIRKMTLSSKKHALKSKASHQIRDMSISSNPEFFQRFESLIQGDA